MKTFLLAILIVGVVFAATTQKKIPDNQGSVLLEAQAESTKCQYQLVKYFKHFGLKHKITTYAYRSVNYIQLSVKLIQKGMSGCNGKFKSDLYSIGKKVTHCNSHRQFIRVRNTAISKIYRFRVSDIAKVQKQMKKVKKENYSILEFRLDIKQLNNVALQQRTFRHYVGIDDTTGAVNTEESQADTDLYMVGVIKTDEDCGNDGNVKGCVAKINLKTVLKCYTDKGHKRLSTKKNPYYSGDTAYCHMEFQDYTIRKYLHIVSVRVKAGRKTQNVVPTPFYKEGSKTNRYTRFRILVYWGTKTCEITANARVSMIADCGDDDCVACDKRKNCKVCRSGDLPQGKKCVKKCESGYWKNKKQCSKCERYCAKCRNGRDCQKCAGRRVLYRGDCRSSCPSGYYSSSYVCRRRGFGAPWISYQWQNKIANHIKNGRMKSVGLCWRAQSHGQRSYNFHSYCRNRRYLLLVCRCAQTGWVFGGYTDSKFTYANKGYTTWRKSKSFLWSYHRNKFFPYRGNMRYYVIYDANNYGPTWGGGHDLYLRDYMRSYRGSYTNLGYSYNVDRYSRYGQAAARSAMHAYRDGYWTVSDCYAYQVRF